LSLPLPYCLHLTRFFVNLYKISYEAVKYPKIYGDKAVRQRALNRDVTIEEEGKIQ
jgi:hypothetical protein